MIAKGRINQEKKTKHFGIIYRPFYMKERTVNGPSSFILCCVRWFDMAVI